ncbi:MAG: hypothetical protein AAFR22_14895 [Chloroflexota bacterium]
MVKQSALLIICLLWFSIGYAQDEYPPITPDNADTVTAINTITVASNRAEQPIALDFNPVDSTRLAVAFEGGTLGIISNPAQPQSQILRWPAHNGDVNDVLHSADGESLFSAGADGRVMEWDSQNGELIRTLDEHRKAAYSLALHPDGDILAVGYDDGLVRIFDLVNGEKIITLYSLERAILDIEFHPNGRFLGFSHQTLWIHIYEIGDLRQDEINLFATMHMGEIAEFEFQPDIFNPEPPPMLYVVALVTAAVNWQSVISWDVFRVFPNDEFAPKFESNSEITYPSALDYNSDGSLIVVGGNVCTTEVNTDVIEIMHGVKLGDEKFSVITTLEQDERWVRDVIFSGDDSFVAAAIDMNLIVLAVSR